MMRTPLLQNFTGILLGFLLPIAHSRPGGMRGAIESAALAVWQELACQIESTSPKLQISNLQISNPPSNLPPVPPRIPPGRLTTTMGLIS